MNSKTVIDWASFLRDMYSADLLANPQQLGGPGHTVAIDETFIAWRKPGNPQGRPVPAQWVFGGVDPTLALFSWSLFPDVMQALSFRSSNAIYCWEHESGVTNGGRTMALMAWGTSTRRTVNHTRHFVDPVTGCHTNNIARRWASCKANFRRHSNVQRHMLPPYIDEYMWHCRHSNTFSDILVTTRSQYP